VGAAEAHDTPIYLHPNTPPRDMPAEAKKASFQTNPERLFKLEG